MINYNEMPQYTMYFGHLILLLQEFLWRGNDIQVFFILVILLLFRLLMGNLVIVNIPGSEYIAPEGSACL